MSACAACDAEGRQRDWYADDRNGNMYYFNMCADANEVPEACVSLNKAVQAPVYEVSSPSLPVCVGTARSCMLLRYAVMRAVAVCMRD